MVDKPTKPEPVTVDFPTWAFLALGAFWIQLFLLNIEVHKLVILLGGV